MEGDLSIKNWLCRTVSSWQSEHAADPFLNAINNYITPRSFKPLEHKVVGVFLAKVATRILELVEGVNGNAEGV